jgi:hypothetical protein
MVPGADLDLNTLNVSSSMGGDLTIVLVGTGYTTSLDSVQTLFGGTLAGPAGSYVTYQTFANPDNASPLVPPLSSLTVPVPGGSTAGALSPQFGPGILNDSSTFDFSNGVGPYSIWIVATIHLRGGGSISFDATVNTTLLGTGTGTLIPEPGSLVLALCGLPVLGAGVLWRQRRRT